MHPSPRDVVSPAEPETAPADITEGVEGGTPLSAAEDAAVAVVEPANLIGAHSPRDFIEKTAEIADLLKAFIKDRKLSRRIGESDHIYVEGWQWLGLMLGTTAEVVSSERVEDTGQGEGWESKVLLRHHGEVVGAGWGQCLRKENKWKNADDYALRSMAQTRAVGKAYRSVYGFVAKAAGYAATPVEEMRDQGAKPDRWRRVSDDFESGSRNTDEFLHRLGLKTGATVSEAKAKVMALSPSQTKELLEWLAGEKAAA